MLKRVVLVTVTIALLSGIGLAGVWLWDQATSPAAAQTSQGTSDYSPAEIITVVGQGRAYIKPDIARVSVGVETTGATISEAVAENEAQMQTVLVALEEQGIAEKDIQTMNYSIQLERYPEPMPTTESSTEEPKPTYRISNMVNVTVRDLDSVGDVLDAVVEAGANNIWGISFSVEDSSAALGDARTKAIEDAGARAAQLAELSGVELGPVMSVSEVISGGSVPMLDVAMVERAAAAGGAISPGELEIGYQVQVSYFIER